MDNIIDNFMDNLDETFGKYKAGMAFSIRQKLIGMRQESLDMLTHYLTREYDMARPPSLKVILSTMHNHNIHGIFQGQYIVSVCEHCEKEFSANNLRCPYCKKLRIYGVIRMIDETPPWHMPELAKMKKDDFEREDIKIKQTEDEQDYSTEISDMFKLVISKKRYRNK